LRNWRTLRVSKAAALMMAAFSALLWIAPRAEAGVVLGSTIDANFTSQAPNGGTGVNVALGTLHFQLSQGGPMDWTIQQKAGDLAVSPFVDINGHVDGTHFITFCVQVNQDIALHNAYEYTIDSLEKAPQGANSPAMGSTAAGAIAELWAQNFGKIAAASPNDQGSVAATFQLAIWKLEYDGQTQGNLNSLLTSSSNSTNLFGTGNLTATGTSTILDAAAAMIHGALSNPNAVAQADLFALLSGTNQDQMGEAPPGGNQTVPEPATAVMCLMGCVCLGGRRLRRVFGARS